jgi:hypothetical protein
MPPRIDKPRSYRWTAADLALLAECRRLSDLTTETEVIRQALRMYLRQLRREARDEAK